MNGKSSWARRIVPVIYAGQAFWLACGLLANPVSLTAQQNDSTKKPKSRVSKWDPPGIDWKLKSQVPAPTCELPNVLQMAGDRANTLFDGLKSFTAKEDIQFETTTELGVPVNDFARSYDYLVLYKQTPHGLVAQDSRVARGGRKLQVRFDQDLGLPELGLIFLPAMQTDYDFECEGTVEWNGQPAWVIHFQQRKDKPHRTISFSHENDSYPAGLRGRAWVATASGEIQHMETSLMDAIPQIQVQHWYLSINYAPITFPPDNLRMLLPQSVDAYCEFDSRRTIAYHTFSEFKLFSSTVTIVPDGSTGNSP
jgi:hypothetical protein